MSDAAAIATVLEAMVERIVERRLEAALRGLPGPAAGGPRAGRWMTPPAAARETGVPVKTIRAWIAAGLVASRKKNARQDARGPKYLVNADEVARVAEGGAADAAEEVSAAAERIRSRKE